VVVVGVVVAVDAVDVVEAEEEEEEEEEEGVACASRLAAGWRDSTRLRCDHNVCAHLLLWRDRRQR
jgi:hypothetical protein